MTRSTGLPPADFVLPGDRACPGCGLGVGLRAITRALDGRMVAVVPASCLTVLGGMYPTSSVAVPWVNVAFPSAAASAAGIAAGLRAVGRDGEMTVVAIAGDGGTADIGIQALSAAAERNDDFIYICYDNEAYMNTGVQRSGLTPRAAHTTTTTLGKRENPKDMPRIMEAHAVPYVASTSIAYPDDVHDKVVRARDIPGLRYIHMNSPCPSGWGFIPKDTIAVGKLAVETGIVVLFEAEDGAFRLTGRSAELAEDGRRAPVADYLAAQARFRDTPPVAVAAIQAWVDERWAAYVRRHEAGR